MLVVQSARFVALKPTFDDEPLDASHILELPALPTACRALATGLPLGNHLECKPCSACAARLPCLIFGSYNRMMVNLRDNKHALHVDTVPLSSAVCCAVQTVLCRLWTELVRRQLVVPTSFKHKSFLLSLQRVAKTWQGLRVLVRCEHFVQLSDVALPKIQ